MRLAKSESVILTLLAARADAYGLELVEASRGRLKRGGIYVTLGRMEEKGLVSSRAGDNGRRLYKPTALGERALLAARIFAGQVPIKHLT
ncbi:MAG TPA: PadR family transcriptional regulator [Vicinamibacterales bacterium]|nr:PadR family transcriptional regulator [Vicinamibacterales bacterium]